MYNLNQIPNVSLSCSERDEGSQSRDQYEKLSRYIDSFAKSYFSRRENHYRHPSENTLHSQGWLENSKDLAWIPNTVASLNEIPGEPTNPQIQFPVASSASFGSPQASSSAELSDSGTNDTDGSGATTRTYVRGLDGDGKKKRRRELNRKAAQRCRDKRRTDAAALNQEAEHLTKRNDELRKKLNALEASKAELLNLIKAHFSRCGDPNGNLEASASHLLNPNMANPTNQNNPIGISGDYTSANTAIGGRCGE